MAQNNFISTDRSKFTQARKNMVATAVATQGVNDEKVLDAVLTVPREKFVPENSVDFAYADLSLKFDTPHGIRILPATAATAQLIMLANIQPDEHVLDIGCLAGYSSAVISHLAQEVSAVESDMLLYGQANRRLAEYNNITVKNASLRIGVRRKISAEPIDNTIEDQDAIFPEIENENATSQEIEQGWDVAIIEGAIESFPHALFRLIKNGGRLVCGLLHDGYTEAAVYEKVDNRPFLTAKINCQLPALDEFATTEEFVF